MYRLTIARGRFGSWTFVSFDDEGSQTKTFCNNLSKVTVICWHGNTTLYKTT